MGIDNQKIIDFINYYQEGKSGIYPNQIIDLVRLEFGVTRQIAYEYVLDHIKKKLDVHS